MKKFLLMVPMMICVLVVAAQKQKNTPAPAAKVDSIFFHLYTDSLKKGTHNYINVDGKFSDGRWQPMTSKDIIFSSSTCRFSGNELVVPHDFADEKITVKAQLKNDPSVVIERTIWIKKTPDPDHLPTQEEVIRNMKRNKGRNR
jgi:hypothetical protein